MAHSSLQSIRRYWVVLAIGLVAGCGSIGVSTDGPPAAAPTVRVGDRWTYRAEERFRPPVVWEEIHEVTAVSASGIKVRVTQRGATVNSERFEDWEAPGLVRRGALFDSETRRFQPPLVRYPFPLQPGQTHSAWVDNFNEQTGKAGSINRWLRVDGWARVATPAGEFDALRIRVLMRLDDEEFWRWPTECNYVVWYAPAVGAVVREEKIAEYREKGGDRGSNMIPIRSQFATVVLTAFTPGPR